MTKRFLKLCKQRTLLLLVSTTSPKARELHKTKRDRRQADKNEEKNQRRSLVHETVELGASCVFLCACACSGGQSGTEQQRVGSVERVSAAQPSLRLLLLRLLERHSARKRMTQRPMTPRQQADRRATRPSPCISRAALPAAGSRTAFRRCGAIASASRQAPREPVSERRAYVRQNCENNYHGPQTSTPTKRTISAMPPCCP